VASSDPHEQTPATEFDVAIIGGGPAGLTAAIYSARSRRSTVVFERNLAGGQMSLTYLIENYPGFPESIAGFDLAEKMKAQAAQFGAEIREITAVESFVTGADGRHTITTDQGVVTARAVILAPGVEARRSGVPGEAEFIGRGVSWCATCDGALYHGKQVAVIGGGDSAVEEGLFLTKFADAVHVIHRRDELRAEKIIQERAFANPKMRFIWDSVPKRILGATVVEGIEYENVKTQALTTLPVDGVFIYIGQIPNTAVFKDVVELNQLGYIVTDELLRTKRAGVFACGDARANPIKQIAAAVGEGALAAVQADRYIDTLECPPPGAHS
jgi:thioredoxin reductase (NADPH)